VSGIVPLGAILRGKGVKKQWGDRGTKQPKVSENTQPLPLIDYWVNFGYELNAFKAKKPLVDS